MWELVLTKQVDNCNLHLCSDRVCNVHEISSRSGKLKTDTYSLIVCDPCIASDSQQLRLEYTEFAQLVVGSVSIMQDYC